MDRATSHARGQCGHMMQCGAHNETVQKIGKNIQNGPRRKTSCNPDNPGPLKTRLSCRADFGADRMDQAAFQCPCHHAHICNRSRACRPPAQIGTLQGFCRLFCEQFDCMSVSR